MAEPDTTHDHEATRAALEAAGHDLHAGAADPHDGAHGDDGDEPLGPIDVRAWGATLLSGGIAVLAAILFYVAAYGH